MKSILENSALIFSIALILGLLFPGLAQGMESLVIPALILAMIFSLRNVRFEKKDFKLYFRSSLNTLIINYLLLSSLIIVLAYTLISDPEFIKGFIVMAAIPPAVAVIPFTHLLKGDTKLSVMGESLCYLFSILWTPVLILLFLGKSVSIIPLLQILTLLIILPLLISRLLVRSEFLLNYNKALVNISLAAVTYTVMGLNHALLENLVGILPILLVLFCRTFLSGTLIYIILRKLNLARERAISYSLFFSYKNAGATAAMAIALFGIKASLPAALSIIFEISYMIFLKKSLK